MFKFYLQVLEAAMSIAPHNVNFCDSYSLNINEAKREGKAIGSLKPNGFIQL